MAQVSAELRWFILDDSSDEIAAVDQWFKSGPFSCGGGQEPRSDTYLLDPSTDELGIKDRGGKPGLEVKALVDPNRATLKLGKLAGCVQVWSKVTSTVLTLPAEESKLSATTKLRCLRKFNTLQPNAEEVRLGAGKYGEDPLQGAPPDVACNVEWTTVKIAGRAGSWRTLGLESFAFNQSHGYLTLVESLERTLLRLVQRLGSPPVFGPCWHELSYPAWLRSAELNRRN